MRSDDALDWAARLAGIALLAAAVGYFTWGFGYRAGFAAAPETAERQREAAAYAAELSARVLDEAPTAAECAAIIKAEVGG